MKIKYISMFIVVSSLIFISGCGSGPKSAKGFSLPDGDAKKGKLTFVELKCHACHTVSGVTLPETKTEIAIKLGGKVTRIKTYGELVTSIINPSHRLAKGKATDDVAVDGQSKMTSYNDVMTVDQLINLVAFLQSHYELRKYEPTSYPLYP
jgi:L-cysteine S-thiosulfotransferase